MKVGLIGFGAMAKALVSGWISQKVLLPSQILASSGNYEKLLDSASQFGITPVENNVNLCRQADIIVIAVKPDKLETALENTLEAIQDKMVITLAVNNDFESLEKILPGTHHISVLPNLPIEVGKGIVVVEEKNSLSEDQKAQFVRLFEPVSYLCVLPAEKFRAAGILTGCGPAFVALFVEGLSEAAVACGISRQLSYELAVKMLEGSAALMDQKPLHPAILKDMVCSPAGTSIKGVNSLKKDGFEGDLIRAVETIYNS